MAENSLQKKYPLDPDTVSRGSVDGLLDDVLEEIPEIDTVGPSGLKQIILFPMAALLIIVLVPLLLSISVFRGTNSPLARDFPYDSLEGYLLGVAMEDISAQRQELNEKDLTIRRLQEQLGNLDGTLVLVGSLVDEALMAREQTLKAETEAILSEERIRLESLEYSEEEMEQSLNRLRRSLDEDFEDKMVEFESRQMSVYQSRIDSIRAERESLERALNAAVEERKALAKALEESEDQVLSDYTGNAGFRTAEAEGVEADLELLIETRKTENYWLDELANQYVELLTALNVQDHGAAEQHLDALESLFTDERIAEIPGFTVRNEADKELVRFFRAYVGARDQSGVEDLITESLILIEQAREHTRAGRLQEASVGWERVAALWPLMDSAIAGSRDTRETVMARDIRRYANLAGRSLDTGDTGDADQIWRAGLEQVPDPMGVELLSWWNRRTADRIRRQENREADFTSTIIDYENRLSALDTEYRELLSDLTAMRAAVTERNLLEAREDAAQRETEEDLRSARVRIAELEQSLSDRDKELAALQESMDESVREPADTGQDMNRALAAREQELDAANLRISELERALALLERNLAESRTAEAEAAKWTLFGVIVQILGDTLVIEPFGDESPVAGEQLRVMRSLGGDRVIHLADGVFLEAGPTRAVGSLSSGASGAEIYGSARVDDLIYVKY